MGVHVHIKAVALGDSQNLDGVTDPFFVVYSRTLSFNGFPSEDVSDGIVSVPPQPREVDMGVVFGERSPVKSDIVAVKEVIGYLRGLVKGFTGVLGVGSDINTTEDNLTPGGIDELAVFDSKAERGHDALIGGENLVCKGQYSSTQHTSELRAPRLCR